jgi:hypothetical protein
MLWDAEAIFTTSDELSEAAPGPSSIAYKIDFNSVQFQTRLDVASAGQFRNLQRAWTRQASFVRRAADAATWARRSAPALKLAAAIGTSQTGPARRACARKE